ncbi:MAG: Panacea domain-containing protein [Bacteroidia bacterium]
MVNDNKFQALVLHIGNSPLVSNLGMTKLWKLIYFIDSEALRELGDSISGSDFIKYEHGPVPAKGEKIIQKMQKSEAIEIIQEKFSSYRISRIVARINSSDDIFSAVEIALIDKILQKYGQFTAAYLSELSHREPAWYFAESLQKLKPDLMLYGFEEDPEGL